MPRATLPAEARLHRPSEFAAALKGKRLARGAFFMISAATPPVCADGAGMARLGMIVAKRFAPQAVTRNTLKRVIREAFRARRHELPPRDYVIRLQGRIPAASLTALKQAARTEVDAHFARIAR